MDTQITGKPTFMAIYPQHVDVRTILDSISKVGYPIGDVSVYYRLKDTDQVVDGLSGQPAAGQSITTADATPEALKAADTVVLLHPSLEQAPAIQTALTGIGQPQILYGEA